MTFLKMIFFSTAFVAFCFCPYSAMAEFIFDSGMSAREEYNDNLYLDHTDKESDFITTIHPYVTLGWENRFLEFSLDLGLDFKKYLDHSENDDISASADPYQAAKFDTTWSLYHDVLFLRVSDVYSRVPIDKGDKGGLDNTLVNLTDINRFVVNPYLLLYPAKGLTTRFDYRYENIWYREDGPIDSENQHFTLSLTKELTTHISASLSGGYSQYRPKESESSATGSGSEDYDTYNGSLSLAWQVSDRLSLEGNIGKTWLNYTLHDDTSADTKGASVNYQLSKLLSTGISYQESISDSTYRESISDYADQGPTKDSQYAAYLSYSDGINATLSLFKTKNIYLETQREDEGIGGSLSGGVPLTDRRGISASLIYVDYKRDENVVSSENYQRYGASASLYYQLKKGRATLGYTWNRNDSDLNVNDYTNNIVFAQVSFNF